MASNALVSIEIQKIILLQTLLSKANFISFNLKNSQLVTMDHKPLKSRLLKCEWSFWYYEKECGKSWEECFHEVAACKSIEEFWILFNSIKLPTDIQDGCNYAVFRSPIRPMWEDERNHNGGRLIITLDRRVDNDEVNRLWLDTLLLVIEEQLADSSSICGVIFQNRWKYSKIGKSKQKI